MRVLSSQRQRTYSLALPWIWITNSCHYRVKLISGAVSHENTGNQFGHASVVFTFIFLAVTAICQIICLNKGLAVYDSTLVVPVFYGVYTGLGYVFEVRECMT